ncbi:hypothetical protein M3Y97_00259100 [Aphelenchoides bicaudatus]|nr:hypothetical protein M3Y97_00259100 [Aphelenchoides bicaudatus]
MTEEEKKVNQKTAAFLCQASALMKNNLHLTADLAVSSRSYGYEPSSKESVCTKCCLSLLPNNISFSKRGSKRKRPIAFSSKCTYCGKQQASMVIKRNATPKKAKKQKEESVLDDEAEIEELKPPSTNKVQIVKKSVQKNVSSHAPPPKSTEMLDQRNIRKRVKTLSKLASLNDDEKNRIGSSAGTSLFSFMNSLKR